MSAYKSKYACTLNDELVVKAKKELNEDDKLREQDIESLRQWMLKQPHIHGRTDDKFLLMFLRNSKFSIEMAKKKIDDYYTIRSAIPEWFYNQDPMNSYVQEFLKLGRMVSLGYDNEGRRLTLLRLGDPKIFIGDVKKANLKFASRHQPYHINNINIDDIRA